MMLHKRPVPKRTLDYTTFQLMQSINFYGFNRTKFYGSEKKAKFNQSFANKQVCV